MKLSFNKHWSEAIVTFAVITNIISSMKLCVRFAGNGGVQHDFGR